MFYSFIFIPRPVDSLVVATLGLPNQLIFLFAFLFKQSEFHISKTYFEARLVCRVRAHLTPVQSLVKYCTRMNLLLGVVLADRDLLLFF